MTKLYYGTIQTDVKISGRPIFNECGIEKVSYLLDANGIKFWACENLVDLCNLDTGFTAYYMNLHLEFQNYMTALFEGFFAWSLTLCSIGIISHDHNFVLFKG